MGAAENSDTLKRLRKEYEQSLEEQANIAVKACSAALEAIGIRVTERLEEKIYDALAEAL